MMCVKMYRADLWLMCVCPFFFFFKQKTAYEIRISDWSSDVCSSDLYAFSFYIWQQVQRWPTNGEEDYPRNLCALSAYLTPSCREIGRASCRERVCQYV